MFRCYALAWKTSSAYVDKPRDAFTGQSRSHCKHGTIPYVRYSFLLCNSNFVFKTRGFFRYSTSKMSWPWNPDQRSLKVIETGTIRYIVYGFLLVFFSNFGPKTHRFERLDFKNAVTLKTGLGVRQGYWKRHNAIERIRLLIDIL